MELFSPLVQQEQPVKVEEEAKPVLTGRKRKAEQQSPFIAEASEDVTSAPVKGRRYQLEVSVPSRRSKLALEKTTSQDNLTLESPTSKKSIRSSSFIKSEPVRYHAATECVVTDNEQDVDPLALMSDDDMSNLAIASSSKPKPMRAPSRKSQVKAEAVEAQPFNIGKFSAVKKESTDKLALSAPTKASRDRKPRASAAKARARVVKVESDEDDYAMDSDEEEKQFQKALLASGIDGDVSVGSSRSSSAKPNLKRSASGRALRTAVGRASASKHTFFVSAPGLIRAERAGLSLTAPSGTSTPGSQSVTMSRASSSTGEPVFDDGMSDSSFASEASESEESDMSASEQSSDLTEDEEAYLAEKRAKTEASLRKKPAKKQKASPKTKAAAKGKGKGKGKKFPGRGSMLDPDAEVDPEAMDVSEAEEDDDPISDDDDEEDQVMSDVSEIDYDRLKKMRPDQKLQYLGTRGERLRRRTKKATAKAQKEIVKKRTALKRDLGRKLTNGENNLVALQHVSQPEETIVRALMSQHHAQLHDVWGDLTANIIPVKPVSMEAHPSLRLTLLPFQKESLYWMKKQEEGVWKGGMLADEMGMGKTYDWLRSSRV